MRDTKSLFTIQVSKDYTYEVGVNPEDETYFFESIKNFYYKGRIQRFWMNGVEWKEPTE